MAELSPDRAAGRIPHYTPSYGAPAAGRFTLAGEMLLGSHSDRVQGARKSAAIFELRASGVLRGGARWAQWAGIGRHVKLEFSKLAGRPMAGHGFLEPGMEVRILPGQPVTHPSGRVFLPADFSEFRRDRLARHLRRGAGENLQTLPLPSAISSRRRGSKTAPKSRPY